MCLSKAYCYKFVIKSRYGKGMCCEEGYGWYELKLNGTLGASIEKFDTELKRSISYIYFIGFHSKEKSYDGLPSKLDMCR
jgi:hypothetical protein